MSQENADVIRGAFEDWNRRDWDAWKETHQPDMVAVPPAEWPEHDALDGREAWFRRVQLMLEPWEEQHLEIDDVQTTGDLVVVMFRWVASGRASEFEVDMPMAGIYTVTGARIARVEIFLDREEALHVAGLQPDRAPTGSEPV